MLSLVSHYQQITTDLSRSLRKVAATPEVKRDADHYLATIDKIDTIDDFLKNDRVFRFAMKAFGLEDMTYAKAYMRKVLSEGIDDGTAFARKLTDQRFYDFAETFNFKRYGAAATSFTRAQQGTVDRYLRATLEQQAGQHSEGLRLALYFERKAPTITSAYGLMADSALYTVVRTALGLPAAMSGMDIDKQASIIGNRLSIPALKTPEGLAKFITRFTAQYERQNGPGASAAPNPAITVMQGLAASVTQNTLMALQTLKR
ncbi:MAG TPA: DUF1217 domain-containing protein [Aestuariivirga sp.]|nr:DUF1217 domain-containing protein [Aestuariivirga sp.]